MRFILAFLATIFIATSSQAQAFQWAKRIGSASLDVGTSIAIDNIGNIYSVGNFAGTVDFDPGPGVYNLSAANGAVFMQIMDGAGNFISAVQLWGSTATQIKLDGSGNIYITGNFQGNGDFDPGPGVYNLTSVAFSDIFILKLDNAGNFIWARSMGGSSSDYAKSVAIDATGSVYTVGTFYDIADFDPGIGVYNLISSDADIFISKLDANGNFLWAKKIGGIYTDNGASVTLDNSGNVYATGYFRGTTDFDPGPGTYDLVSAGQMDVFILKLDAGGNFQFAKRIGISLEDEGTAITIDNTGNIYAVGYFSATVDFNPGVGVYNLTSLGPRDAFILKLDMAGNFLWAKKMGGSGHDYAVSAFVDNTGNIYTLGLFSEVVDFDPGIGIYNLGLVGSGSTFLSKLDNGGNFVWAKSFEGAGYPTGKSILGDNVGNIYIIGSFNGVVDFDPGGGTYNLTSVGSNDIFVHKYNYCGTNYNVSYDACDSISLFGTTYTQSGDYVQQFADVNECDSNLNMHIQLHPTTFDYPIITVCDSIAFGGNMITVTGIYTHMFTSVWGCDSTVILDVTIKHSTANTITQTACNSYTLNGQTYTSSGVYTQTLINAVGCDSIITVNLTINYSSGSTFTATSCGPFILNGQTYNASGTYTQTYVNAVGCDSVVTLNLTVNQPTALTINQAACVSYTLNGQTYNASGTYTQTLVNAVNCDSVITLNLTINQPSTNTINQTACNSYTLNGQTYNTTGTYTQTLVNAVNCDSVITLNLTINTVNTAVTQAGALLTATATPATYQWLRCNPYQDLPGETNQSYTATANGDYAVAVTQNGCTDTSICYTVIGIGINDYLQASKILLYPNPVTQKLVIENEKVFQNAIIKILSVAGQIVIEQNNISEKKITVDMSKLVSGIYFVEIEDGGYKFVRVVTKE